MLRYILKSKIHRATITHADLEYEGSITLDKELMEQAKIFPYEKVSIYNISNGERFDTYVIEGERGSGVVGLNGAAARKGSAGDLIIIASYALVDEIEFQSGGATLVFVDSNNRVKKKDFKKWLN